MMNISPKDVDFVVLKEDYSRYLVSDGTIIKAKIVVKKILFNPQLTPEGYPQSVAVDTINAVSAMVPHGLKRNPTQEPWNPMTEKGEEMKFDEQSIQLQEYMTPDGFKITVKPVVTKIFKYSKYNNYGEPTYNINIQAITNIEKIESTA
jgi:hypothetical protein